MFPFPQHFSSLVMASKLRLKRERLLDALHVQIEINTQTLASEVKLTVSCPFIGNFTTSDTFQLDMI